MRAVFCIGLSAMAGASWAADLKTVLEPVPGSPVRRTPTPEALAQASVGQAAQGMILTEAELLSAVRKDLPKRFPVQGELRVQLVRPWVPMQLPGKDFFAECLVTGGTALAPQMMITVRGVSDGKIVGEWPLQFKMEVWQDVWVASQRLDRGQILAPGMISVQRVDSMRETTANIPADTEIMGKELAQPVQQGRMLASRDLVERSLVKTGQYVDAIANEGGLSIRMRAVALESGAAGKVIRIRNLVNNKEFVAQVVGENQVQVRF